MKDKIDLAYAAVPRSRLSKLALWAALSGTIGTLSIFLLISLWSIQVEGFERLGRASAHLELVWQTMAWIAILLPLVLSLAAKHRISCSHGQLRGGELAFWGAALPGLLLCIALLRWLRD